VKNFLRKVKPRGSDYFRIVKGLATVGAIFILLMAIYITADVGGRYLFNSPVPAAFEIAKTLMAFIAFLALAYTLSRGGHLRLGFVYQRFGPRGQAVVDILSSFIGLILFGVITWQAAGWAWEAWQTKEYMEGILKIPYFPAKVGFTIGAFFFFIQFATDLTRRAGKLSSQKGQQNNGS